MCVFIDLIIKHHFIEESYEVFGFLKFITIIHLLEIHELREKEKHFKTFFI